jgi:hypothetical protein
MGVFLMAGEAKANRTGSSSSPPVGKLPYEKPSFRHDPVFETMALRCGKIAPTQAQCRSVRKAS